MNGNARPAGPRGKQGGRRAAYRLCGGKTRPDQPEPNARIDESEDAGEFRLISLEALVRMKLAAFRDKDRVHLRDLVSIGLVDESWLPGLSTPLRERLALILSSPEG